MGSLGPVSLMSPPPPSISLLFARINDAGVRTICCERFLQLFETDEQKSTLEASDSVNLRC